MKKSSSRVGKVSILPLYIHIVGNQILKFLNFSSNITTEYLYMENKHGCSKITFFKKKYSQGVELTT